MTSTLSPLSVIPESQILFSSSSMFSVKKESSFLSTLKKGIIRVAEEIAEVASFVFIGLAAMAFFPLLAPPFFAFSVMTICSRLVLLAAKSLDRYHVKWLSKLNKAASSLIERYPNLQLILFIFILAMGCLSQDVGIVAAGLLGILNGVLIEVNRCQQTQQIKREELSSPCHGARGKFLDS